MTPQLISRIKGILDIPELLYQKKNLDPLLIRRLRLSNHITFLLILVSAPYFFIFLFMGFPLLGYPIIFLNLSFVVAIALMKKGYFNASRYLAYLIGCLYLSAYQIVTDVRIGSAAILFAFLCASCIIFSPKEKLKTLLCCLIAVATYYVTYFLSQSPTMYKIGISDFQIEVIHIGTSAATFSVIYLCIRYLTKDFILYEENMLQKTIELENAHQEILDHQNKEKENLRLLHEAEKLNSMITLMNEYHHELKAPWGNLYMACEMPNITVDELKGHIRSQYKQADSVLSLSMEILAGNRQRKRVEIHINDLIEGVLDIFPVRVGEVKKMYGEIPPILGDPQDLQIMFINIFKNAVEAFAEVSYKEMVTIRTLRKQTNHVSIIVADTGPGIPHEIINNIGKAGNTTKEKGSGIGLFAIKRIVEEHGGTLTINSVLEVGTTFMIDLPVEGGDN